MSANLRLERLKSKQKTTWEPRKRNPRFDPPSLTKIFASSPAPFPPRRCARDFPSLAATSRLQIRPAPLAPPSPGERKTWILHKKKESVLPGFPGLARPGQGQTAAGGVAAWFAELRGWCGRDALLARFSASRLCCSPSPPPPARFLCHWKWLQLARQGGCRGLPGAAGWGMGRLTGRRRF